MHYRFAFYVLRRVLVHVISVLLLKIILPSRIPAVILFIKFLVFSMQVRFTDDIDDILFFYVTLLEECMTIIQTRRSTLPLKYLMYMYVLSLFFSPLHRCLIPYHLQLT